MDVAWYWARSELRQRWRTWLSIAVLVGIGGGLAVGAIAGARRTQSAYPRFLERADAPDFVVDPDFEADSADFLAAVDSVPGVARASSARAMTLGRAVDGVVEVGDLGNVLASVDGDRYYTSDRVLVTDGRLPDPERVDEVLINDVLAARGVGVGDELEYRAFTVGDLFGALGAGVGELPAERGSEFQVTVTGVGIFPELAVVEDAFAATRVMLTPAAHDALPEESWLWDRTGIHLTRGADASRVRADIQALAREAGGSTGFEVRGAITGRTQRAVRPYVLALSGVGVAGALLVLLLAGQLVRRTLLASDDSRRVMDALAVSRGTRRLAAAIPVALVASIASLLSVIVAAAMSSAMPVGPVRRVEPQPGIDLDWFVVPIGVVLVSLALLMPAVVAPAKRSSPGGDGRVVSTARRLGVPLAVQLGIGRATGGGTSNRRPARVALTSVALALASLSAIVVFGASVDHLLDEPETHGWNADAALVGADGYGALDFEAMAQVEGVEAVTASSFDNVVIDGTPVAGVAGARVRGDLLPPLVDGRHPVGDDELALGSSTLDQVGARLGDQVEVVLPEQWRVGPWAAGSTDGARSMTIVGSVVLPGLGHFDNDRPTLGEGVLLVLPVELAGEIDQGWSVVMVDLAEGADRDAVVDRLVSAGAEPSGNTKVYSLVRPVDIESFARLGSVPLLIAGLFAAIAMASLVHVLVVSSRSWRRDRAILSALGASSSQLRSTCRWQALSLVAFASVVAVPVGGAVGRAAWQSLAAEIGVLPEPLLPVAWLLALVAALAGVAVATAAPLERLAARHRLADSLRDRP